MIKHFYILFAILVTISAVIPSNTLVVCQKEDGSIIVEFKNGDVCECDAKRIVDEKDDNCCIEDECHDDAEVTSDCHEQNQITSANCVDTEIEFIKNVKSSDRNKDILFQKSIKYVSAHSAILPVSIRSLIKPFDVGKFYASESEILSHSLLLKKTSVFLI